MEHSYVYSPSYLRKGTSICMGKKDTFGQRNKL